MSQRTTAVRLQTALGAADLALALSAAPARLAAPAPPSGLPLDMQAWFTDLGAPSGLAASNGVLAVTPWRATIHPRFRETSLACASRPPSNRAAAAQAHDTVGPLPLQES